MCVCVCVPVSIGFTYLVKVIGGTVIAWSHPWKPITKCDFCSLPWTPPPSTSSTSTSSAAHWFRHPTQSTADWQPKKNHQTLIVIVQYPSPLEQESIFYFHSIVNLVDTTPDWPVQCQSSRINQNSATGVQLLIDSFRYFVEYSTNQLFGVMAWPIGKKAHLGQRLVAASTGSKLIVIDAWPFRVMPLSLL